MWKRRGGDAFRRAGRLGLDELGLPATRGRTLQLDYLWQTTAGAAIARRTQVRLVKGLLTIGVEDDDPVWERTVRDLLPRVVARMARSAPGLGVRRFRVVGSAGFGTAVQEVDPTLARDDLAAPDPAAAPPPAEASDVALSERLERAMERYLGARDQKP